MYVIFEGIDGSGKSTTMDKVAEKISAEFAPINIQSTKHPGATPLGAHLRTLTKYPEQIDPAIEMDELSRQLLFMVDTVCFVKTVLEPSLKNGETVFADRSSFISAIVYGTAGGLGLAQVNQMFNLVKPPRADRLYVFQCPWEVARDRIKNRADGPDVYERKSKEFYDKVQDVYGNLVTGPPERSVMVNHSVALDDVLYIDATMPVDDVVATVTDDLTKMLRLRSRK
jgi:dTMP kinase